MKKNKSKKDNELITIDNPEAELFVFEKPEEQQYLAYLPTLFTTASLPFRNVNKTVFERKGSNGIALKLTSPTNVPFGKYGRLLLSVLTTHAVLEKNKNGPVLLEYEKLSDLLTEMQLPKSRGKDIKEQLECFTNAAFSFTQKVTELKSPYLFEGLYEKGEYPKQDILVTTHSTGNIRFTEGVQYKEADDGTENKKSFAFKIILSPEFASFCKNHAVPINYTVYKTISSAIGKDIYAWLVYRNNSLKEPIFVPRSKLVEQFNPVEDAKNENQENVSYFRILENLREIKEKYYPELKVSIDAEGNGITLFKSPAPVLSDDTRYALITSDI